MALKYLKIDLFIYSAVCYLTSINICLPSTRTEMKARDGIEMVEESERQSEILLCYVVLYCVVRLDRLVSLVGEVERGGWIASLNTNINDSQQTGRHHTDTGNIMKWLNLNYNFITIIINVCRILRIFTHTHAYT